MTPVERLQAAIEKLEHHIDESWHLFHGHMGSGIEASNPGGGRLITGEIRGEDADLIVTLHRTLVAQLAILRFAVDGLYDLPEFLMLADAILGGDS